MGQLTSVRSLTPGIVDDGALVPPVADPASNNVVRAVPTSPIDYSSLIGTATINVAWKNVHTAQGTFDTTVLDTAAAAARTGGYTLHVRLTGGLNAPQWVKNLVGTVAVVPGGTFDDGSGAANVPRGWETSFRAPYVEFMTHAAAWCNANLDVVVLVSVPGMSHFYCELGTLGYTGQNDATGKTNMQVYAEAGATNASVESALLWLLCNAHGSFMCPVAASFVPWQRWTETDGTYAASTERDVTARLMAEHVAGCRFPILSNLSLRERFVEPNGPTRDYPVFHAQMVAAAQAKPVARLGFQLARAHLINDDPQVRTMWADTIVHLVRDVDPSLVAYIETTNDADDSANLSNYPGWDLDTATYLASLVGGNVALPYGGACERYQGFEGQATDDSTAFSAVTSNANGDGMVSVGTVVGADSDGNHGVRLAAGSGTTAYIEFASAVDLAEARVSVRARFEAWSTTNAWFVNLRRDNGAGGSTSGGVLRQNSASATDDATATFELLDASGSSVDTVTLSRNVNYVISITAVMAGATSRLSCLVYNADSDTLVGHLGYADTDPDDADVDVDLTGSSSNIVNVRAGWPGTSTNGVVEVQEVAISKHIIATPDQLAGTPI